MKNEILPVINFDQSMSRERVVLSSIIHEDGEEIISNTNLTANDFIYPFHSTLFKVCQKLHKDMKPIEEYFLKIELEKINKFDEVSLLDILSSTSVNSIQYYSDQIIKAAKKRNILHDMKNIIASSDDLSPEELIMMQERSIAFQKESSSSSIFTIHNSADIEAKLPYFYLRDLLPIQKNEICMLTAKGGGAKSMLGLFTLLVLTHIHKLKVFGFFSEDDIHITKHRLEKLQELHNAYVHIDYAGKESRPNPFVQKDKNNNYIATTYFYQFKNMLKDYDVILLDPLIAFIGSDENSNTEARFFMNLLNEWIVKEDKTIIIIHHHSKSDNGNARGAGAFVDAVRLHYIVEKDKSNERNRKVQLEKNNHYDGKNNFTIQLFGDRYNVNKIETPKKNTEPINKFYNDSDF